MMIMSDSEQKQDGKIVKFGVGQLANDTPIFMKYILRIVAFLSGLWAILPQDLIAMDDHTYGQINRWIVVGNTMLLFAIKFFGWDTPNNQ